MKVTSKLSRSDKRAGDQRGVALVTTLAVTMLMTVLILSFFVMARTEYRSAKNFEGMIEADALSQTAISLAISQLRAGMTQLAEDGTPLPWTSQPGALRVHNMDGTLRSLYKLYSSGALEAHALSETAQDVPINWDSSPVEFVDLNQPSIQPDPLKPGSLSAADLRFPIADPRQRGRTAETSVEGFDYGVSGIAPAGVVGPESTPNTQRLPMPVRWIYTLADGTLGLLSPRGEFSAILGSGRLTAANRIVGRVAFWTDDETSKINVNTSSEGVYWDTPRATTTEEMALGMNQPIAGEYNRFPGHPAMVSLSSVLFPHQRYHAASSASQPLASGSIMKPMDARVAERLWTLSPVLKGSLAHTSMGGHVADPGLASNTPFAAQPDLTPPLAAVGDLLFKPTEASVPPLPAQKRAIDPLFVSHPEALDRLSRGSFFLTAHSEAPETNLFGMPRMGVWPVHEWVVPGEGIMEMVQRGSAHDYMMALTTTLARRSYYWQRSAPADGHLNVFTTDLGKNRELFAYARALTSRTPPGFARPGLAASFAEKYGATPQDDRDNILLSMFDYVRQTNFNDPGMSALEQFCITCPADARIGYGQVSPLFAGGSARTRTTDQLKPADLFAARGTGRMLTVSEVSFVFICRAEVMPDGTIKGEPSSELAAAQLDAPGKKEVQMAVLVEGFVPSQGWGEYRPYLSVALGGKPGSDANGVGRMPDLSLFDNRYFGLEIPKNSRGLPASPKPPYHKIQATSESLAIHWTTAGGITGPRFAVGKNEREIKQLSTAFLFQPVVTTQPHSTLNFSGATGRSSLQLAIYDQPDMAKQRFAGDELTPAGTGDLMQIIPLQVPALKKVLPPSLPTDGAAISWEKRLQAAYEGGQLLSSSDVIQSLVPAHGDYRLIAASRTLALPENAKPLMADTPVFVPHPLYGKAPHAHSLREGLPAARQVLGLPNRNITGFFPDLEHTSASAPDFPWHPYDKGRDIYVSSSGLPIAATAAEMFMSGRLDGGKRGICFPHLTGDFDNGVAWAPDGPYINRADDGEVSGYTIGGTPYFDVAPPKPHELPQPRPRVFGAQRQIPSPAMFGSLPTGVKARVPWQTLLFRPQGDLDPATWTPQTGHYGWSWPRDHLFLDLFWMPVQEPAALSTANTTQGKINLNHHLVPFSYIQRSTALHALLKAEKMLAIPDTASRDYKLPPGEAPRHESFRRFIDAKETIAQWDREVLDKGDAFLTASQICEHYLVPEGMRGDRVSMEEFWSKHRLTGDNAKERPYANIYGRLTTRSNTYRVHFIAESLRTAAPDEKGAANVRKMAVMGRQEGSALIERVFDPSDPDLPDYVAAINTGTMPPSLENFYNWRIRSYDRFIR